MLDTYMVHRFCNIGTTDDSPSKSERISKPINYGIFINQFQPDP